MERVKIMFGTEDALNSSTLNSANLASLAGVVKSNLQKFNANIEEASEAQSKEPINQINVTSNDYNETMMSQSDLNSMQRQNWLETEMSYDDTSTIIEDVDELQKDNAKDSKDRDQSLSGKQSSIDFFSLTHPFSVFVLKKLICLFHSFFIAFHFSCVFVSTNKENLFI